MLPKDRYLFNKGALVLIRATCHEDDQGKFVEEPGQKAALEQLRAVLETQGFEVVLQMGLPASAIQQPTAEEIVEAVDELSNRDLCVSNPFEPLANRWRPLPSFLPPITSCPPLAPVRSAYDALMVVLCAHGVEGGISCWPLAAGPSKLSGPIDLRSDIFTKFQHAEQVPGFGLQPSTKASTTLLGKPKVFLIDACREVNSSQGVILHHVQHPTQAPRPQAVGTAIFDGHHEKQWYSELKGADGQLTTRYHDFVFGCVACPYSSSAQAS